MNRAAIPDSPRVYETEEELAEELIRRIGAVKSGVSPTFDASETMRRARQAVQRVRQTDQENRQ